jgi:hypothetical protein
VGLVSLIGRLVKVALVLGALGTLGEAVFGMAHMAAGAHQTGLVSLLRINKSLDRH